MKSTILSGSLVALSFLAGCAGGEAMDCLDELAMEMEGLHSRQDLLQAQNGTRFNGVSLNGVKINGVSLNGKKLNGVSLNGILINGTQINGVGKQGRLLNGSSLDGICLSGFELRETRFEAELSDGTNIGGEDFIGAQMLGTLSDGSTIRMRIDDIQTLPTGGGLLGYEVSVRLGETWQPLCGLDDAGSPVLAIPLNGIWDYRQGVAGGGNHIDQEGLFTFACRGAALAKCVEFGYLPWKTPSLHQACTRLVRADFCGDGRSWTEDGTLINLYDAAGIQQDTEEWRLEAV